MGTAPAKKRGPYRFSFHTMSARMESGTVRLMDSVATRLYWQGEGHLIRIIACGICRGSDKSQVRQCLDFCTADFKSSFDCKSAVQKPKHCLTETPHYLWEFEPDICSFLTNYMVTMVV